MILNTGMFSLGFSVCLFVCFVLFCFLLQVTFLCPYQTERICFLFIFFIVGISKVDESGSIVGISKVDESGSEGW